VPRPPREQIPGELYHLTANGVRRTALFRDDADRRTFLWLLARAVTRYRWTCAAYCLLTTHYHLLIRLRRPNMSDGMQWLNSCYAQRFNRRHAELGHAFRSRYHSVWIERETHALEVVRYIALNPVRAGTCPRAREWPWSSYGMLLERGHAGCVTAEAVLELFDLDLDIARSQLRSFVEAEELAR
jgi:REP-associated tyrosine transposase